MQIEKLELVLKKLDIKRKKLELIEAEKESRKADQRMALDQISQLRNLMTERMVDDEKTLFANEVRYKNALSEEEVYQIKSKILTLIKKF
jgi:hypothetical protein